ncbi:thiamine pyrophosphate-binding protein [Candidatus Poribacteria bacterium]
MEQRSIKAATKWRIYSGTNALKGRIMNTADHMIECLINEGVKRIFGYPGIGNQTFLDSVYKYPQIEFFLVRHEQVAALTADAYARITGFPAVCTATYGGGATNLVNGIAQAYKEMSPVIAIAGERLPGKDQRNIDQPSVFRPITKLAVSIKDPAQAPGAIRSAFHVASTEPVGPVYIGLPTDVAAMQIDTASSFEQNIAADRSELTRESSLWPHALNPEDVMTEISHIIPPDAIVTVDVGDIMVYMQRFLEKKDRQIIRTGNFYSMGFGLPAAMAAKIARPDSEVYCIVGDGGLAMVVHDLETAVRENLKVNIIVLNNSTLSMIRRRQINSYERRIIGCDFCDIDFATIAHGFCAAGERVTSMDELKTGMENAHRSELPYVLDIVVGWDEGL